MDTVFYPPAWGQGMYVGGGAPRTPSGVDYMSGKQGSLNAHEQWLRPVVGLVSTLSKTDVEQITVEAIRRHRQLRDEAEALEVSYSQPPAKSPEIVGSSRLAWVSAMIYLHTQQTLLSTLLDVLGYIPDVPDDECGRQLRSA